MQHIGVHPTAVVHGDAVLGEDVEIGPYCVIGPRVVLGRGCKLQSHVIVDGDTHIGEECRIFPHAVLGTSPQDKKLGSGEANCMLRIGSHNQIREFTTIHGGTEFGGGITRVGSHNMLLAGSHIGHDATVGDHVIMTNSAMAAGHTVIEDHAILGAMVGVHQFARVGQLAMIGAGAMLSKDAPPFGLVQGDRARLVGINVVGLKRAGHAPEQVQSIKAAYRSLFWRGGTLAERLESVAEIAQSDGMVRRVVEFVRASKRGLVMPRGRPDIVHDDRAAASS